MRSTRVKKFDLGLKRIPNETVKCNAFTREKEARRFPHRYIEFVKSPDEHTLQSNSEMPGVFQVHNHDHFACRPDLQVQDFHSFLADFLRLGWGWKRLAVRVWILNAKPVSCWSSSVSTSHKDWMVCPKECTWGCVNVCPYSDGYVQPLVCPGIHSWQHYQGCDPIPEEK